MEVLKNDKYATKPLYEHMTRDDSGASFKHIRKAKFPYKIKILLDFLKITFSEQRQYD
jgi:hypothetical protein